MRINEVQLRIMSRYNREFREQKISSTFQDTDISVRIQTNAEVDYGVSIVAGFWILRVGFLQSGRPGSDYQRPSCARDRGREGLPSSPPSELCMRFSRTQLSSQQFPFRGWLAAAWASYKVKSLC